jgi:hypothetical protein
VAIYVGTVDTAFPDQHDLRVGETFTLLADVTSTLQSAAFDGTALALLSVDYNNVDYRIRIPNEASFPGKTRCLVKVEAVSATGMSSKEYPLYVDIPEMAPHKLFIKHRRALGMVFGGIWNTSSILDCGVMGQSTFGQTLSVKLKDGANNSNIGDSNIHSLPSSVAALAVVFSLSFLLFFGVSLHFLFEMEMQRQEAHAEKGQADMDLAEKAAAAPALLLPLAARRRRHHLLLPL